MPRVESHPSPDKLREFHEGRAAAEEVAQIADHVAGCARCQQFLAELTRPDIVARLRKPAALRLDRSAVGIELPPELRAHPDYDIRGQIGQGGMGVVYQAIERATGRAVAIKTIQQRCTGFQQYEVRFRREAAALRVMRHAAVVRFDRFLTAGDYSLIVMEFVPGSSLRSLLNEQALPPLWDLCRLTCEALAGLAYIHRFGLVHRDIKPDNLIVTPADHVKIVDFGIVRSDGALPAGSITDPDAKIGSPLYMAPEQWNNPATVDGRADLYSLGVTLYELATGKPPFTGSVVQLQAAHCAGVVRAPRELNAAIPEGMSRVIRKMMARDPRQRYQSAHETQLALSRFATSMAFLGTAQARSAFWRRLAVGVTLLGVVLALCFLAWPLRYPSAPTSGSPKPSPTLLPVDTPAVTRDGVTRIEGGRVYLQSFLHETRTDPVDQSETIARVECNFRHVAGNEGPVIYILQPRLDRSLRLSINALDGHFLLLDELKQGHVPERLLRRQFAFERGIDHTIRIDLRLQSCQIDDGTRILARDFLNEGLSASRVELACPPSSACSFGKLTLRNNQGGIQWNALPTFATADDD